MANLLMNVFPVTWQTIAPCESIVTAVGTGKYNFVYAYTCTEETVKLLPLDRGDAPETGFFYVFFHI